MTGWLGNVAWSQVFLFVCLGLFLVYVYRVRTELTDRLFYLLVIGVGLVFIARPEWSTRLANLLGIGRGADLMMYLFIVTGLFFAAAVSSRHKKLEQQITQLVRQMALREPLEGPVEGDDAGES